MSAPVTVELSRFREAGADELPPSPIINGEEFLRDFQPPEFLIDPILQRNQVVSLTGRTNSGKTTVATLVVVCVLAGIDLAGRKVQRGNVLYIHGENVVDLQLRTVSTIRETGVDRADALAALFVIPKRMNLNDALLAAYQIAKVKGEFALVVVDTKTAYFDGDSEDDNLQADAQAAQFGEFKNLPGKPCVLVLCHPTKNGDKLEPRGGSGFLNAIDCNLTLSLENGVATLGHTKIRGPNFDSLEIELKVVEVPEYTTKDGKPLTTVVASPISTQRADELNTSVREHANRVLYSLFHHSDSSLAAIGQQCGGLAKNRVSYVMGQLLGAGFVQKEIGGRYVLTNKGKCRAKTID